MWVLCVGVHLVREHTDLEIVSVELLGMWNALLSRGMRHIDKLYYMWYRRVHTARAAACHRLREPVSSGAPRAF